MKVLHGRNNRFLGGKMFILIMQNMLISLFLSCNMAAVQNSYYSVQRTYQKT